MTPEPHAAPATRRSRSKPIVVLALLLVALAGVLAARYSLYREADISRDDRSALPRPRIDAPFITSPNEVVQAMVELADLRQDDLVYDLGCGDGRIVIAAAEHAGCRGIGFDKDPQRVAEARENAEQRGVAHLVQIEERDIFTLDLSEADVIFMYLLPWMIEALKPQFETLEPGTRIVSHDFFLEGIEPDKTVQLTIEEPWEQRRLFLYVTPLKKKTPEPAAQKR